jgi:methionine synthase I (cobalamin-dependent)/5,10-methylenetetrahydrofolate reductase
VNTLNLKEKLKENILIGDGAIGTLLYSNGIDQCFDEASISQPDQIHHIHQAYINAGADIIQTNTYGANYTKLSRHGLQDHVKEINKAAVRIAKQAATKDTYVVGTIGGLRGIKKQAIHLDEVKRTFREQLYCLLLEDVDGILLETFYDLEELTTILSITKNETDLPVIAQVSLHEPGNLQDGTPLPKALKQLEDLGADIVGINCRLGPYHMIRSLEDVPLPSNSFLSAYPNASLPDYEDGRLIYPADTEYFKKSALELREQGVRLIGGCCGTTPEHIRAIAEQLKGLKPVTEKKIKKTNPNQEIIVKEQKRDPHLHEIVKKRHSIIVELDPPKQLNISRFMEGSKALHDAGIDAITLADNSLASPRISNLAMATLLKTQLNSRPLVHITCRDRNLIGLQSHLMGLHSLGLNQVLAVTGDPTKIGDFPGASSVYDLSSFELIQLIKQFNEGISFSGKSLGEKTSFSVAAAFNPNVRHLDKAVQRIEKKINYGADYFISQPLYSKEQANDVYQATKHLKAPLYIGIMPLTGYKNAEFLHNEVPGIKLSDEIRDRMKQYEHDPFQSKREGITIAKELIDAAFNLFNGIYLITPFLRYDLTVELVTYINQKIQKKQERTILNDRDTIPKAT